MFNQTSLDRMNGTDPRLMQLFTHLRQETGVPFEITEALRNQERQQQLYNEGKSGTLKSNHLTGNAADIHILNPNGSANWDFNAYVPLGSAAKAYAQKQGWDDFRWGGDFSNIKDGVHFEFTTPYAQAGLQHGPTVERAQAGLPLARSPDSLGDAKMEEMTDDRPEWKRKGDDFLRSLGFPEPKKGVDSMGLVRAGLSMMNGGF